MKKQSNISADFVLTLILVMAGVVAFGGARQVAAADDDLFIDSGQSLGSSHSYDLAMADLDGDGDLDVLVANGWLEPNRIWLSDGSGVFSDSGQSLGNSWSHGVALADLDGDEDPDAFVTNWNWGGQANKVWLNDGSALFTDSGQSLGNLPSLDVALGDVDGDGDPDAFVANGYALANKVWLNDGAGNFTDSGQNLGNSQSYGVVLEDVDNDGDLDAFVVNNVWPGGQPNKVWLNDGTGGFSDSGQNLGTLRSNRVVLGDLDDDGDLDAVVMSYSQGNTVWMNDGSGVFGDSGQSMGLSSSADVALGDVDGDGDLDAFVANENGSPNKLWLNDGTGFFTDSGLNLGNGYTMGVALGDFDGDLDLDAFAANGDGYPGTSKVWLNTSPRTFLAIVDIRPDTLNLKSKGKWMTAYVELQGGHDVADVDVSTVMLEDWIPAEAQPTWIGDHDRDGFPDLMLKFDRQALIEYLGGETGEAILTVSGELGDGAFFDGSDVITMIRNGKD